MSGVLLDLLRAARGAGVRISTAEALDAFQAADAVGFADREALRDSLTLSLAKTVEEKQVFESCFDRFFSRGRVGGGEAGEAPEGVAPLAQMVLENDEAGLAAAMEAAGEAVGASGITLFTQTNMFARRMLDRMGLAELDREIERRRGDGEDGLAERMAAGRQALAAQARGFMERQLALFSAGTTREIREGALRSVRLSALDRRDMARMRALIRELAKRLATRYSRRRWQARRGALDARRTMRRNMSTEGVPFRTVWKRTRIDRPKIMTLCDVSGSVAAVARFLLMFLYGLADVLAGIRSFAYSNRLIEVSDILERAEIDAAITQVMEKVGFGSSDYGKCLADFSELALGGLDRQTTVIVLGDARGNGNDPRTEVMRQVFERAGRVIWLNPEPRSLWGVGDSDIFKYAPYCHRVVTCNTVAQLERVVSDLLRDAG